MSRAASRDRLMVLELAAVAAGAIALGALTTHASPIAGALVAAVLLIAFLCTVRQGLPMLALAGLAIVAVSYTQATQGGVPSAAKYLTDAVLVVGVLLLVRLRGRLTPKQSWAAGMVLICMATSAVAGVLGGGNLGLALIGNWQDARWLGAIGIGVAIADALQPAQRRRWTCWWLVILNALGALVAMYQIQAHDYTSTRLGFPQVSGLFGQTTANALAATVLLIFVLTEWRSEPHSMTRRQLCFALGVGLLDLLLSTRFKPALALVAVAAFLYLRQVGVRPLVLALLAAAIPVTITLALAWATTPERAQSESEATANIIAHAAPRVQFMDGAGRLAAKNFPLGAGSGTYGSDLSPSRERVSFDEAGLAGQYGFRTEGPQFNSDNFVAHVLGERGYAGLVAWLLSLAALVYFALVSTSSTFPPSVAVAAASLTPVVPVFRDGASILLLFIPATLCMFEAVRTGSERQTPRLRTDRPLASR